MTKTDTHEIKSNEDMKFSIDNLADEADVSTTTEKNDLYTGKSYTGKSSDDKAYSSDADDMITIVGSENTYALTNRQYSALEQSFESKKNFIEGPVNVLDDKGEVQKSVLGIVAFSDIYRKFEINADTSQVDPEGVPRTFPFLEDEEDNSYACVENSEGICLVTDPRIVSRLQDRLKSEIRQDNPFYHQ